MNRTIIVEIEEPGTFTYHLCGTFHYFHYFFFLLHTKVFHFNKSIVQQCVATPLFT